MWSDQLSVLFTVIPRCLCVVTFGIFVVSMSILHELEFWALAVIERCSLFSALKSIPHVFAQLDAAFISKESVEHSWLESFPTPYADVSSAKSAHSFTRHSGKSLINRRKRVGPNTVPWGIPDITVSQDEQLPFTWTHWRRLLRNDENHCSAACENPVWDSL